MSPAASHTITMLDCSRNVISKATRQSRTFPGDHRRTGQHPFGGGRPSFARMDSVGGGGGSSRNFPGSVFCGVAEFFPLPAVTDPNFVFFTHVLCFARIMSTLCPNSCRQTARIAPPPPSRTPMLVTGRAVGLCYRSSLVVRQTRMYTA